MAMETHLQELRFPKERQWAVAIATITFIAGAFHMAHTVKQLLAHWEKWVATTVVLIVAIAGSVMLVNLQYHLRRTRLIIDWRDRRPLRRGLEIVTGLVILLVLSATAVCYSFWRDEGYHLLLSVRPKTF